jgi:penicillin-binding protein 2
VYLDSRDQRPSLTPQLAMRVAVLGGVALVFFALIFFRLWFLQVLSGDNYRAEANDNRVRAIKVQAPRGEIVDREGRVLVENRVGLAVKVNPATLPDDEADRRDVFRRLGGVLDMRPRRIERKVEKELAVLPYAKATVKQDVDRALVAYLMEHQEDFPGVEPERVFLREYPHDEIGAHLFGYTGEVSPEELKSERFRGVEPGDRVGKAGIEAQYDRFLRGLNGAARVQVDALGNVRGEPLHTEQPEQGRQLRLSLDLDVQEAGQQALAGVGTGAFVAMNVNTGEMLGLGSSPSFDPNLFSPAISTADWERLNSEEAGKPYANRAIASAYPTGSTFKLVTAMAALEGGLITPGEPVADGGSITVGGVRFQNAGNVSHGVVDLRQALSVSSDVYFYKLGQEANNTGDGLLIQSWARKLGLGRPTGIDLPFETPGLIPTPDWRNRLHKRYPDLHDPWSVGHNINLSVGQGDLQADPLQLAVAYATVANGGKVVQPRLGQRIEDSGGRPLQELQKPPVRRVRFSSENADAILEGLRAAASEPGGTSAPVFADFPIPIAGKTGTAEKGAGRADQSWYAALAPYPNPKYVVVTTFEAGGFGAETAAPAARRILSALFDVKDDGTIPTGTAAD